MKAQNSPSASLLIIQIGEERLMHQNAVLPVRPGQADELDGGEHYEVQQGQA